jgi:hypothetical protein
MSLLRATPALTGAQQTQSKVWSIDIAPSRITWQPPCQFPYDIVSGVVMPAKAGISGRNAPSLESPAFAGVTVLDGMWQ